MDRLKKYASENNIPIMQEEGILFLKDYIVSHNVKTILEIGSAIGYSAIQMASLNKDIKVVTIERDKERYNEALKNIKDYKLQNQIEIILGDALETKISGEFDLIFIDAAKAQYIKFFEKYKVNLKKDGVIVSDNLLFHGLTLEGVQIESRNLRALVRKINNYKKFLQNNEEFDTIFLEIGDGISISQRKNKD